MDQLTEIDLRAGLKDEDAAKKVVKQVMNYQENLLKSNKQWQKVAEEANAVGEEFVKRNKDLTESVVSLSEIIKNTHLKLNEVSEKLPSELDDLRKELSKFVISSGMIKLGVISNDSN